MDRAAQETASEVERVRGEIAILRLRLGKDIADLRVDILKFRIWMAVSFQTVIIIGAMVALVKWMKP